MVTQLVAVVTIDPISKINSAVQLMNGATEINPITILYQLARKMLAGREGFEPSIPAPKAGALPLGDRPSGNF